MSKNLVQFSHGVLVVSNDAGKQTKPLASFNPKLEELPENPGMPEGRQTFEDLAAGAPPATEEEVATGTEPLASDAGKEEGTGTDTDTVESTGTASKTAAPAPASSASSSTAAPATPPASTITPTGTAAPATPPASTVAK